MVALGVCWVCIGAVLVGEILCHRHTEWLLAWSVLRPSGVLVSKRILMPVIPHLSVL
jgi:hypothetical protein